MEFVNIHGHMLMYLDIFFSMGLSKPLCSLLKTCFPCGYFFWGQTFYVTVRLPSQLPERNVALLVLVLPSGTVLELCRIIVLRLYAGVRGHTHKHTPLPLVCLFPWCCWKDQCREGAVALRCFYHHISPLQISLLLCTPGLPEPAWLLLRKNSQPIHQRGRPKAFDLIYLTLSL